MRLEIHLSLIDHLLLYILEITYWPINVWNNIYIIGDQTHFEMSFLHKIIFMTHWYWTNQLLRMCWMYDFIFMLPIIVIMVSTDSQMDDFKNRDLEHLILFCSVFIQVIHHYFTNFDKNDSFLFISMYWYLLWNIQKYW